jgi:hypothetical protein
MWESGTTRALLSLTLIGLFAAMTAGCSGASGLDRSKKLVDLSQDEWNELCNSAPRAMDTPSCPMGHLDDINDPSSCMLFYGLAGADCTATVATSEECAHTLAYDPCHVTDVGLSTPACLVTQSCFGSLCQSRCQSCASDCMATCVQYTAGLTKECAACIMSAFGSALTCPDFTALPPDHCGSVCPGLARG